MVKKKKVLVIIALVLFNFVVIGIAYACSNIEDTNDATTIASSDNNLKEIKNIDDEDVVETLDEEVLEEQEIVDENTSEEIETDNVENIETEDEKTETVSNIQETTVSNNIQTVETTDTASTVVETEQQSTAETVATENVETSNTQETTSTESTTQSEVYWCIDGGSHHVEGDGVNEHGYYSTWDLAWSACQEYMKGLDSSCHYKVAQCWCGLFYFWVEQN